MTEQIVLPSSRPRTRPARLARGALGRRSSLTIALALAPGLAFLLIFFGVPLVQLIQASLSRWTGVGAAQFIGLNNYAEILSDGTLLSGIVRSLTLAVSAAVGICAVALLLGALISGGLRGNRFYRVVWFLPAIAPPAAVAVFWSLAVQPNSGVVNAVLGALGLGDTHAWLADPATAMWVIVAVAIWQGVGFAFLVLLGAMEEVPVSAYEAAAIDGAGVFRRFFSITLPLIRPVLSMVVLLEVIWAFNGFTLVWGMTKGGPGDATAILPVLIYKSAFQFGDFGPAAAMSVVGGLILLTIGFLGNWLGSRKGVED